ncbi:MAG: efflux transporter outer membrane subunit [Acidobacteriota bacterium]
MERLARYLLLLIFCVSGCAVGPDYKRPVVDTPVNYRSAVTPAEQASFADLPWWDVFKDETLQRLIAEAMERNYDLRIAVTRIEQSRQIAARARSQFFPQVDYNGAVSRGRNSSFGEPASTVTPETTVPVIGDDGRVTTRRIGAKANTTSSALLDVTAFWEIDLWGRIRRLNEAALADLMASEDVRRGVVISLVSNVAQAYFELLEFDLQLEIAKKNTISREETLKIFSQRLQGGAASRLETASAEALVGTTAADIPELERQIVLKENQINVLLGRKPGPIERHSTLLDQSNPIEIPAGLPSALLERRPDIRQAEESLHAANARVGVAKANFFPQIGLTALFGKVSSDLSAFTGGISNMWGAAATMSGPLFHGGSLTAEYRQAKAEWEEARLVYEQTALNAFQEVSDALISREKFETARVQQARAVKAYEEAVEVSLKRYVAGKASYYEVLQNQQNLYPAETTLALTRLNQLLSVVQLYKALGGGWQPEAGFQEVPKKSPVIKNVMHVE